MHILKTKAGRGIIIALSYLLLAFAMTYPLVLHLRSFTMTGTEDGAMSVWNLWWMKYSLLQLGQSPLETTYLFYPDGASLTFHSLPKVLGLISIPLQYLAGITIAYNIVFLLTFVVTGLTTYLLAYHLLGDRIPAFLTGAFFAFSAIRWNHVSHLQLLSTMLIPVYILLVIKAREALEKDNPRSWLYFSLAGLTLVTTAYDTEYYTAFLIMFSAIYLVFWFPFKWSRPAFRHWVQLLLGLMLAGAICVALFAPMLVASYQELASSGDYVIFPAGATTSFSSDILHFFVPQENSKYLGPVMASISSNLEYKPTSDSVYLGWVAIIMALGGIWYFRRRRDVWLWVTTASIFAVLALGTTIRIKKSVSLGSFGPYLIITKIPVLNSLRVPSRFGMIAMLAVAVLAGFGAAALFGFLRKRGWATVAIPAVTTFVLLGIIIEYSVEHHLTSLSAPPAYAEIAASDIPGSVITLPLGWEAGSNLTGMEQTFTEVYQIEHHRPLVGGMLARAPKDKLFRPAYTPVIDFLADPVDLEPSDLDRDPAAIARFQEHYQVAFIVAHKGTLQVFDSGRYTVYPTGLTPEALDRVDKYVIDYLHMEKFAETDDMVAYRRR